MSHCFSCWRSDSAGRSRIVNSGGVPIVRCTAVELLAVSRTTAGGVLERTLRALEPPRADRLGRQRLAQAPATLARAIDDRHFAANRLHPLADDTRKHGRHQRQRSPA